MRKKLTDFISQMSREELQDFQQHLKEGSVKSEIDKRLSETPSGVCPVCNNTPGKEGMLLVFGPQGLRKRASFCGFDCLEYFLGRLKKANERQMKDSNMQKVNGGGNDELI